MNIRLIISFTIFLTLGLIVNDVYGKKNELKIDIIDADQIFPDADEQIILNALTQNIESDFAIPITVVFTQNNRITTENSMTLLTLWSIPILYQKSLTLFVNPIGKESRIIFRDVDFPIEKSIISSINRQFLIENLTGQQVMPLAQAIPLAIMEVRDIQIAKKQQLSAREKALLVNDSFSVQFYVFLVFVLVIVVTYFVQWLLKQYQKGENFEKFEFSTYGRLPKTIINFSSYFIICILIAFLYFYLYFYDEWIYSSGIVIVASIPLTHAFLYVGLLTADMIKLRQESKRTLKSELPLVPAMMILDADVPASKLMEATFNSLVMKGQLEVHYELKYFPGGRSKKYAQVEKGRHFDLSKGENYELPFLEPIQYLDKEYGYFLPEYLNLVKKNIRGTKYFKKDLVSIALINRGLISNSLWVVNKVQLSRKGLAWKTKVEKVRLSMNNQIIDKTKDAVQTVKMFDKYLDKLLLVNNSIDLLYNNLSHETRMELQKSKHLAINYLLSNDFEVDGFSRALKNCYKKKIYNYDEDNY